MQTLFLILALLVGDVADEYQRVLGNLEPWDDEVGVLLSQLHHGMPPTPEARAALDQAAASLAALERVARSESIDWELDYDQGPELLLPELSTMRHGTRLLDARFLTALVDGHGDRAAADLNTAISMSEHIAQQELLISSLVAIANASQFDNSVSLAIDMALIDAALAEALLPTYERMGQGDWIRMKQALRRERDCMIRWLDRKLQEDPQAVTDLGLGYGNAGNIFAVAMMRANLQTAEQAYDRLLAAVQTTDHEEMLAAIETLEQEVQRGDFGPMAAMLLPPISPAFSRAHEARELFRERTRVLRAIAEGELEPWERAQRPWLWVLAARRATEGSGAWWLDDDTKSAVQIRLAQAMGASDGRYPESWGEPEAAVPWWLPDQWVLLRGLMAHAATLLEQGRGEAALVDVSLALDITGTLARDGRPAPALVAAEALPMLADLVDGLITARQDVTSLAPLVRRLPRLRNAASLLSTGQHHGSILHERQESRRQRHDHWASKASQLPFESHPTPPTKVPLLVMPRDAAGTVAAYVAMRALSEPHVGLEPAGVFDVPAPAGVDPTELNDIEQWAQGLTVEGEPHALPAEPVDPSAAADATARLRAAVIQP
ncbi:MAG: hypothetical protein MK101_05520 [Phycisphaerales bacterium]|nr:hypothetical protein [Phycisphaerales bacterium]